MKSKKSLLRCILFSLLLVLAFSCLVEARSVTASKKLKKAKAIKKGTTVVYLGGSKNHYVKFKAPKTKKYKFTVTDMKSYGDYSWDGKDIQCGNISFGKLVKYSRGSYLDLKKVATYGGKSYTLYVCTRDFYNTSRPSVINKYTELTTRTGSLKLKKGQVIYLSMYTASNAGKNSFKITIK